MEALNQKSNWLIAGENKSQFIEERKKQKKMNIKNQQNW